MPSGKYDGATKHPLYSVYNAIKARCYRANYKNYHRYGGRGIKVCNRWLESFWNFVEDMGERPEGYEIDRIDNNGNYEPSNCRWATRKEQTSNTSVNVFYEYQGEVITETEAARVLGLNRKTLADRRKRGWSTDDLLFKGRKPSGMVVYLTIENKTAYIAEWSKISGTPESTISGRRKRGWSDYECVYGRNKGNNNEQDTRPNQQNPE